MTDLEMMLTAQLELQRESFDLDPTTLEGEERIEFIRWNVLALLDEVHEVLHETGWKPWASSRHVHESSGMAELVDAWHFMMNLMLVIGQQSPEVTARAFTEGYFAKRQVNASRQTDGYTG